MFPNVAFHFCPANSDLRVSVLSEQRSPFGKSLGETTKLTVLRGGYAKEAFLRQDLISTSIMKETSDMENIFGK